MRWYNAPGSLEKSIVLKEVKFHEAFQVPWHVVCRGAVCAERQGVKGLSQSDLERIARLYQRLQTYVGWTAADLTRLRTAWPLVEPHVTSLVEDFYAAIQREPETARIITGGSQQIARLKLTLAAWLAELFQADRDAPYAARRWFVGYRHVDIGLQAEYVSAAMSRLRIGLVTRLLADWKGNAHDLMETLAALDRALDLELALIDDAYQTEYRRRLQQMERLATIGQVAGGIAHELRNPLNVIQTSVYYLKQVRDAPPQKRNNHLERIERQVRNAERVIAALNDYARLPLPVCEPVDLGRCLRDLIRDIQWRKGTVIHLRLPDEPVTVSGDQRQLGVVMRNLLANARDAIGENGTVEIVVERSAEGVELRIRDDGCGMTPEVLAKACDPLFTTKPRGMGLGLALVRMILQRHGATFDLESQVGQGTTARVRFRSTQEGSP
ncbi:MAG: hypothetical protein KatS3mg110_0796 [Pirellulaceae bacterium]|nr:MAG: hypothetical protein KatS3mg110_0796 [Pirellulaceae bacterium]